LEFVPDPLEPETVIATAPAPVARNAVSAAEIVAVICVELTKVVGRGEPFQLTTRPGAKPVPVTVSMKPLALQYGVLFALVVEAETDVTVASVIGKGTAAEAFALPAGLATVTCAVPTAATSASGTVAVSAVGPPNVVASCVVGPFVHCTIEHGRKLVPVKVNVAPELPAVALAGEIDAMAGVARDEGAVTEKLAAFEIAWPFVTPIPTPGDAFAKAISEGEMTAVSCDALTNVVGRPVPFVTGALKPHITVEPFTKFAPFTVSTIPEVAHEGVDGGDKEEMLGGLMAKVWHDAWPGVMLNTSTQAFWGADPEIKKSLEGTVAVI
jgi:hypothetical protein